MKREELKNKIIEVVEKAKVGSVATIHEGTPWVRYMIINHDGDLTFSTTTFANSRKIEDLKKNNSIHVAIGGDPNKWESSYVNMQGTAEILTDLETKKQHWCDMLSQFFSGPDDPNFVVLKIRPKAIEFMEQGTLTPQILETS